MMAQFAQTLTPGTVTAVEVMAMANNNDVPTKWIRGRYLVSKTSGTTGERAIFVTDRKSWDEQGATMLGRICRDYPLLKIASHRLRGDRFRMGYVVADCPFCVTKQTARQAQIAAKFFSEVFLLSVMTPLEEAIEKLNEFKPHFLYLYPSCIAAIARQRLSGQRVEFDPEIIITGCELLTADDQQLIRTAFPKTKLINQYGATECPALGLSCSAGNLHLNLECVHMEPVDAEYRAVPRGEFSEKILLTNLTNYTQPLIRYESSDSVRIVDEPCSCGSALPVIEIRGRADDVFFLLDRFHQYQEILPLAFYTGMFNCPEINFCQVVHVRQNELELRIKVSEGIPREKAVTSASKVLKEILASRNVEDTTLINVKVLSELPRAEASGKFKSAASLVPKPDFLMPESSSIKTVPLRESIH